MQRSEAEILYNNEGQAWASPIRTTDVDPAFANYQTPLTVPKLLPTGAPETTPQGAAGAKSFQPIALDEEDVSDAESWLMPTPSGRFGAASPLNSASPAFLSPQQSFQSLPDSPYLGSSTMTSPGVSSSQIIGVHGNMHMHGTPPLPVRSSMPAWGTSGADGHTGHDRSQQSSSNGAAPLSARGTRIPKPNTSITPDPSKTMRSSLPVFNSPRGPPVAPPYGRPMGTPSHAATTPRGSTTYGMSSGATPRGSGMYGVPSGTTPRSAGTYQPASATYTPRGGSIYSSAHTTSQSQSARTRGSTYRPPSAAAASPAAAYPPRPVPSATAASSPAHAAAHHSRLPVAGAFEFNSAAAGHLVSP